MINNGYTGKMPAASAGDENGLYLTIYSTLLPAVLSGLALAMAAPQAAHAQASERAPARVSVEITEKPLTLGAREEVIYDSNVVHGPTEAAQLRGLEKAEFIVTPGVTLDYGHNNGRVGVALNGVFGYDFHEKNTMLNRERIDFSARSTALIGSSCSVTGKYNLWRKQTRQQDLTTIVTSNTVKIYVATLAETCISSGGLIQNVQILRSAWHNSSPLNINNDRKAISGMFGHTDAAFGTVGITLLYERTAFSGRPAILIMTPDTLEKTSIGLQFASPSGRRLSGSLSAGYVHSIAKVGPTSRLAGKRTREGLVAQAAITYKPTDRLSIAAQAGRRIRHDTSFTVTTDAQLAAAYAVSPKIQASIGVRWLRDVYYGRDITLPQIAQDRQDQTTVYGTMTFQVGRRTSLAVDARHERGRADFSLFNYSGTRLSLTLASSLENLFRPR